jgi:hypothetical protein
MFQRSKPAPWSVPSLAGAFAEALEESDPARSDAKRTKPMVQYQRDPIGFLTDVLGIDPLTLEWSASPEYLAHEWDGTVDPLIAALHAVAEGKWVAVASGTGTGKTFLMAALAYWHLASFEDSVTVTIATKEDQMEKGVWREMGRMWPSFHAHFPDAELTHLRIRMDSARGDAWAAWAVTAKVGANEQSATGVQGLHAKRLLALVDEMPGVPPPIVTALVNTATDDGNIIAGFGNPDYQHDPLGTFAKLSRVTAIRISALDHPNVVTGRSLVPGAVSRGSIAMRRQQLGEDSPLYQSRVRGIAPDQASNALIHREWIDQAVVRHGKWPMSDGFDRWPVAYGVDPSNSDGGDKAARARMQGPVLTNIEAFPCPDANVLGAQTYAMARREGVQARYIGVDAIGVGAGTVNEIRRLAAPQGEFCAALNAGASPVSRSAKGADGSGTFYDANLFLNLRAQMHWQLREDLRQGLVALPYDPELIEELVAPTYEVRSGKVVIEPKADVKLRIGRSPNKADAFVMANWVRPRTVPLPVPPADMEHRHLGWKLDAFGKRVPKTTGDVVREQQGVPRETDDKWWKDWGRP